MTVGELIKALEKEPNKDKPVKIYVISNYNIQVDDVLDISDIDYSISDRLDINAVR